MVCETDAMSTGQISRLQYHDVSEIMALALKNDDDLTWNE